VRIWTAIALLKNDDLQDYPDGWLPFWLLPLGRPEVTFCYFSTINRLLDLLLPAAVVTVIGPEVAPVGTVTVIWVDMLAVNSALVLLNVTDSTLVKPLPFTVTVVPTLPCPGVKLSMVGDTVKLLLLAVVPPLLIKIIGPVIAPGGTITVTVLSTTLPRVFTVTPEAVSPVNFTEVNPSKLLPLSITVAPTAPLEGAKLSKMAGIKKVLALVALPLGVVIPIEPESVAGGTIAVIDVELLTV
jgi:hypothetical protein